jgi:hypothetical protein
MGALSTFVQGRGESRKPVLNGVKTEIQLNIKKIIFISYREHTVILQRPTGKCCLWK